MPGSALDFLLENLPGAAGAVDHATRPERLLEGPLPSPVLNTAFNIVRAAQGNTQARLQLGRLAEETSKGLGETAMGVAYPHGPGLMGPAGLLPGGQGLLGGFNPIEGLQRAAGWAGGPIPERGAPLPDSSPGTTAAWTLNPDAGPLERLGYAIERTRGAEHYAPEQLPGLKGLGELAAQPTNYVGFGIPERLAGQVSSPLLRSLLGAAGEAEHAFTAIPGGVLSKAWEGAQGIPGVGRALETSKQALAAQAEDKVNTLLAGLGQAAEQFPQLAGLQSGWRALAARENTVNAADALATIKASGVDATTLRHWDSQASQDKALGREAVSLIQKFTPSVTEPIYLARTRAGLEAKAGISAADTDTLLQEALAEVPNTLLKPKPPEFYTIADIGKGARRAQDARLAAQGGTMVADEPTLELSTKAAQMAYLQERYGDILPGTVGRSESFTEAAVAARVQRAGGAAPSAGGSALPSAAAPSALSPEEIEARLIQAGVNPAMARETAQSQAGAPAGAARIEVTRPEPVAPRTAEERAAYYAERDAARAAQEAAPPPSAAPPVAAPEAVVPPAGGAPAPYTPTASPVSQLPGLYSEMNPRAAAGIVSDDPMLRGLWASPSSDLALGQGMNRGVLVEFTDLGRFWAQAERQKPASRLLEEQLGYAPEWIIQGTAPGTRDSVLRRMTIDPARVEDPHATLILEARLQRFGWQRQELPDGRIVWENPRAAPEMPPGAPERPAAGPAVPEMPPEPLPVAGGAETGAGPPTPESLTLPTTPPPGGVSMPPEAADALKRLQAAHGALPAAEQELGVPLAQSGISLKEANALQRLGQAQIFGKGKARTVLPTGEAPPPIGGAASTPEELAAQHSQLTDSLLRMNTKPGDADFVAKLRNDAPDLVTRYEAQQYKAKALQAEVGGDLPLRQLAESKDPEVAKRAKDILGATGGGDILSEPEEAVINQMWGKQYLDSLGLKFQDPNLMQKGYQEIMQIWRQQALFAPAFFIRNQIDASARMLLYAGTLGIDHPMNPFTARDPDSFWQIFGQAWKHGKEGAAPPTEPNLGVADKIRAELTRAPTPADVVTGMAQQDIQKGRGLEKLSGTFQGRLGGAAMGAAVGAPAGLPGAALGAGVGFVAAPWMGRMVRGFRHLYTAQEQIMRSTGYNLAYRAAIPKNQAVLETALEDALGDKAKAVFIHVDHRGGMLSPKEFSDALDGVNATGEARAAAETAFGEYRGALEDAGRAFSHKLFINYRNTTNADEWMRQFFGFHVFATRSLPFYAETLATHPGLLAAITDFKAEKERQAKSGGYSKNKRMVYGVGLPSDEDLTNALFGHAGQIFIDPTGYVSLVQGAIQATQDSPDAKGTNVVGNILNQLQRVGLSPTPVFQTGAEIAGLYGGQPPQNILRTEPMVQNAAQMLTGQVSEAPWKTLQRQRMGPLADRVPNDPAMTVRRELVKMALEQDRAYADANPTAPISPRFRQAMELGDRSPLYQDAVRRLSRQGLLEAGASYLGAPLRFRSNTEAAIDQVGAALPEVNATGGSRPLEPVTPNPGVAPGTPWETPHLHAQRLAAIAAAGRPEAAAMTPSFTRNVGEPGGPTQPSVESALRQAIRADYKHADPARQQALLRDPATRPYVLEYIAEGIKTPLQPSSGSGLQTPLHDRSLR